MLSIPVEDVRVKDYSPEYGTVIHVRHAGDAVTITFKGGDVINRTKGDEMEFTQGGRF